MLEANSLKHFFANLIYAKTLLSSGEYSIAEISEKSGFKDVKYFSRVVKKEYGVPPSKLYRRIKE